MINNIFQTQFGVLDWLYSIKELNIVPEIDQTVFYFKFKNTLSKTITLHAVDTKVGISNKVAISCTCKKSHSLKSQYKYQK